MRKSLSHAIIDDGKNYKAAASIDGVKRARFDRHLIEHRHVMHFAVGNVDKTRDVAAQVRECVQLDRAFATTEFCPREQRQN
jgi:hypothetical protein